MKLFIRYFSYLLLISGFFRIFPIITAWVYGESMLLFVETATISIVLGLLLLALSRRMKAKESALTLAQALMLVALSFIVLPLIGAISFMPSFSNNYLDATFESISGFTTTGLTLYPSIDHLPKSLLLWRAETQWLGGIGIIMVFLFVFSRLRFHSQEAFEEREVETQTTTSLFQAQGFPERLEPGIKKTTANIILIYTGYTILGIILLWLAGMSFYNSVSMTFTSLSTGGFSTVDLTAASTIQLAVLTLIMLIGATSFIAHNKLLQRKFKEFLASSQKNIFLVAVLIAIVITLLTYKDLRVVVFELVSSFTTTGYSISEIVLLPQLFIMLIMLGMIIGGCVASTAGGMKISRVYTLIMMVPWFIRKLLLPKHAVVPFRIRKKSVDESSLLMVAVFVFTYLGLLVVGTIIFLLLGYNLLDSSFQITSALGTVGLQTMELAAVPWLGKIVLILAMLLGRLEIFPLFILLARMFKS